MRASTPKTLGQVLRAAREEKGWSQAHFAQVMGTSRQWVIALEQGSPNVRLGMVLDAISYLGLMVNLEQDTAQQELASILGIELSK